MKKLIAISLIALTLVIAATLTHDVSAISKKEKKIRDDIRKKLDRALEGKYSNAEIISLKKFNSNSTVTIWNKTKAAPIPPPVPPTCLPTEHLENGKCVPNETPSPLNSTDVCMSGDIEGTSVIDEMGTQGCDLTVALGDLGYDSNLAAFKKQNWDKCVIGNHDAAEDGSDKLYKEALAYCGDSWFMKIGNSTLLMGFNTNGNLNTQLGTAQDKVMDPVFMSGINNVHIITHKPCVVPPASHHPVEAKVKTFCDSLKDKVPAGVKVYFDASHNHVMAQTKDGLKNEAGGGGRSHYDCGTNAEWVFCNDKNYGFLKYTIGNDGTTASEFITTSGSVLYPK
jgi:hypothetical protein